MPSHSTLDFVLLTRTAHDALQALQAEPSTIEYCLLLHANLKANALYGAIILKQTSKELSRVTLNVELIEMYKSLSLESFRFSKGSSILLNI